MCRTWIRPWHGRRSWRGPQLCPSRCGGLSRVVGTDVSDAARPCLADIERIFSLEYGRAVAVLTRIFGDIDAAEEAVQDAFLRAVERWPHNGLPPNPQGWIITTARNRAIDRLRREALRGDRQAQAAYLYADSGADPEEDA